NNAGTWRCCWQCATPRPSSAHLRCQYRLWSHALVRHLPCPIGNPNGEHENREHDSEPEQKTKNTAWIVPKLWSLPRTRLIRAGRWVQIRIPIGSKNRELLLIEFTGSASHQLPRYSAVPY